MYQHLQASSWLRVTLAIGVALALALLSNRSTAGELTFRGIVLNAAGRPEPHLALRFDNGAGYKAQMRVTDDNGFFLYETTSEWAKDGFNIIWTFNGAQDREFIDRSRFFEKQQIVLQLSPGPPPLDVSYMWVSGVEPSLIVQGVLDPSVAEQLGGQQPIVPTTVLAEISTLLEKYGDEGASVQYAYSISRVGGRTRDKKQSGDEYIERLRASKVNPKLLASLKFVSLPENFFLPDLNAVNDFLLERRWPRGYTVKSSCVEAPFFKKKFTHPAIWPVAFRLPGLWRNLTQEDLRNYTENLAQFVKAGIARHAVRNFVPEADYMASLVLRNAPQLGGDGEHELRPDAWFQNNPTEVSQKQSILESIDFIQKRSELWNYIAKEGLPADFGIVSIDNTEINDEDAGVCGEIIEGSVHGIDLSAQSRTLELQIAVFKNTSEKSLHLGNIEGLTVEDRRLRSPAAQEDALHHGKSLTISALSGRSVPPGGGFVVPIQIRFSSESNGRRNPVAKICKITWKELQQQYARQSVKFENTPALLGELLKKPRSTLLQEGYSPKWLTYSKGLLDRLSVHGSQGPWSLSLPVETLISYADPSSPEKHYYYGLGIVLGRVVVDGVAFPIRRERPESTIMVAGWAIGCCPLVLTRSAGSNQWINEGTVLKNAVGPARERTDEMELRYFGGQLQIREIEKETSILDRVELILESADGTRSGYYPKRFPALVKADGDSVILRLGEVIDLDFGLQENEWRGKRVFLSVTGYYQPFEAFSASGARPILSR